MEMVNFLYRRPDYLPDNKLENLDTIVIHHTGNDNDIHTNTDYHMDNNRWSYLGYNYYVHNGIPVKVRGYQHQSAAVSDHNHHTISIAVQGNYDTNIPSQADMEAVQFIIDEIKKDLPHIKYIKGHREFNDTSCPGKLFPLKSLKLDKVEYVTKEELNEVKLSIEELRSEFDRKFTRLAQDYQDDIRFLENHLKIRRR